MKSQKKVLLYSPYIDTFGGGEKHYLSILKVLENFGFQIDIAWTDSSVLKKIDDNLGIHFKNALVLETYLKKNTLSKLLSTKEYDILIYVTDGSYFFSLAKKNYVFSMVPDEKLYKKNLMNGFKLHNFTFISNSNFTQINLRRWGINSEVIYPYIDKELSENAVSVKKQYILSVGRFFSNLHNKNHIEMIKLFNKLVHKNNSYNKFKLILAGRVKDEDKSYFNQVSKAAMSNQNIEILPNLSSKELLSLYKSSLFYWHFTGVNVDEKQNPQQVEHLGIAPLEAMASGCIVFAYNAGGIRELVQDGKNGFSFSSYVELQDKMSSVMHDEKKQLLIRKNCRSFIDMNFSFSKFEKNVGKLFSLI